MASPSSSLDYLNLFLIRPMIAVSFVLSLILLGWYLAWKLVLVHVPLVQEIFGLRKKTIKPRPLKTGRFSDIYNRMDAASASASAAALDSTSSQRMAPSTG